MQEGEVEEFDGVFLHDRSGERGEWEWSLTEEGSMDEPSFNIRFSEIRRPGAIETANAGCEIHGVQETGTLSATPSTEEMQRPEKPGIGCSR
jgi:hypothetical protein